MSFCNYRLGRIKEMRLTDQRFVRQPFDLAAYWESRVGALSRSQRSAFRRMWHCCGSRGRSGTFRVFWKGITSRSVARA
ncbi:MAG: hypothetical protein U0528_20460 [Anaerolineae bacterium]